MKLNLLPKSVAKNVQSKAVFFVMLLLVLGTAAASFVFARNADAELAKLKQEAEHMTPLANIVVETSAEADTILEKAKIVLTNAELVKAIDAANAKYPNLYNRFLPYIPSFLRVRSITAASAGENKAVITLSGYLQTFQQYSDTMIALLRFPEAVAVGRSGFGPVPPGDTGPFGYDPATPDRGPIPGWSAVTFTVVLDGVDLRAPDPRATLAGAAVPTPGQPGGTTPAPAPAPGGTSGMAGKMKMG